MNKKKLLALLVSSAFLFAACGDDNSVTPVDPDDESSSSVEESSSSKGDKKSSSSSEEKEDKSSSSKKDGDKSSDSKDDVSSSSTTKEPESSSSEESSSSVEVPQGAHVAELKNLAKNIQLNLFGHDVFLSTGSKQGVVSLRIPDELWIVTYTKFENGVVSFEDGHVGVQYTNTEASMDIKGKLKPGFKISFIVDADGETVKYAVDDSKEYKEAVSTKVSLQTGKLSKAEDVKDKAYECVDGDTTRTFTFFDNHYLVENSAGGKVANWMAGYYDIHRSTLLMIPAYFDEAYTMYAYSVGNDDKITTSDGDKLNCTKKDLNVDYYSQKNFVGEWQAENNGVSWTFTLKNNGQFLVEGSEGNKLVQHKAGTWEFYGDHLMLLTNLGCLKEGCTVAIHGQVKPKGSETSMDGFTFDHSDPDTPKIPTSFDATQYEE